MLPGRDGELRELLGAAATALAGGRGFTALLCGEAGIGKSRLAAEFADRLGIPVAWAACPQDGGAPPYWPWAQVLDRLGRSDALTAPDGAAPAAARFQMFDAVAAALRASAPVLIVLDDLHWADRPSLLLLEAIRAHLGAAPVLVLGTYRDTEPEAGAVAAIAAERRLALRGLTAGELAPAIADATGETITPEVAATLRERTGGNPFFAAELVRLLRAEGDLAGVPSGVRAVLDRRLDRLPQRTEAMLRAAAVLDAGTTTGLDPALLAGVAGEPATQLGAVAAPAVAARLLRGDGGRSRFPHALVAETLVARTPPAQRLALHRRAARALIDPAGVARHLLAAARLSGDPGEAERAAAAAGLAADAALAGTAYEDAVGWLTAALAIGGPARGQLLCALGEAALAAGDRAGATAAFAEAAVLAAKEGDAELLATAALGAAGGAAGFEIDMADPDRCTLLEAALLDLPAADSRLRCLVTARLSVALSFTGAEPRRRELAAAAVTMARRLAEPRTLAAALAARCDALAGPDHVDARRAMAAEIVERAGAAEDRTAELLGRRLQLVALAEAGEWPGVDREIEAYARAVERLRRPDLAWYVPLWRGSRAAMRGEPAPVAELEAAVRRSGSSNARLLQLTQALVLGVTAGRAADVLATFDRFLDLSGYDPDAGYCTLAMLRALDGETQEAARLLAAYLDVRTPSTRDSEWLPELVQAAMTAAVLGDETAAARIYPMLAPYAGIFAVEGILAGTWGSVDAHLGRLAQLLGQRDTGARHFAAAGALDSAAGSALARRTAGWARTVRPAAAGVGTFTRTGEVWTVEFAGRGAQLRDSKGLRDLAVLLAAPGREVAVHELAGAAVHTGSFELADRTAIDAYRRRLRDLEDEVADAEETNDLARGERARAERDALIAELAAVTGLGGRPREAGSVTERLRKAVGNRIRAAIGRVEQVHPELGRHLRVSVRTGTFCRYAPEHEVRWTP